jgi:uracil-DNA glycosylase
MPLDALLADIRACRACAADFRYEPRPVISVRSETRILVSGQAPGRRVHESGLPFDDPSGDRLRRWMGVDRATFYGHPAIGVAGQAFCYPGTDKSGADYPPPPRCAVLWRRQLIAALPNVELTLLLGAPAQAWALRRSGRRSVSDTVAAWRDYVDDGFLVMPHPSWRNTAWLQRHPWFEAEAVPYLRERVALLLAA